MTHRARTAITRRTALAGVVGLGACASLEGVGASGASVDMAEQRRRLTPFACNVEMWWSDQPFLDRFAAAADHGFTTVEMWRPVRDDGRTPEKIRQAADAAGVQVASISPGAPAVADPANLQAFLRWVADSIALSDTIGTERFNVTGHRNQEGMAVESMVDAYTAAMTAAAPMLERAGKVMTIEPYNPYNHPGHFINGVEPALSICRRVDSPAIKIMWDLFHMQRTDGNVVDDFRNGIDQVDYVQFADSPDRHQPGTGEMNYAYIFREVRAAGYDGILGAECRPRDGDGATAAADLAAVSVAAGLV